MSRIASLLLLGLSAFTASAAFADPIVPLTVAGANYHAPDGRAVRFWGVNLVSAYPDHAQADAIARNLASRGINLARPHHNLRPGKDWNPAMVSGALVTYRGNSRELDPDALDRFDYFNAALRREGIYLALSTHQTRAYLAGDVDILETDPADRDAWMSALAEMNGWPSRKSFDLRKLLPVIDERAALLTEEFVRKLFTHKNPYSGFTYAEDPQVISVEIVNEHALEYAIICQNRLPDYWQQRLEKRWSDYAAAAGIDGGDLYKTTTPEATALRAKFLTELDEAYFKRISAAVRAAGSPAPLTYSNLWRGDSTLEMHARHADFMENHAYIDPLVVRKVDDGFAAAGRIALADKPFFIGEFNQAEGEKNIREQSPYRSMLMLAGAAHASFNDWSGIVWFAWNHGQNVPVGDDGWAINEGRESNLGSMVGDGMMLDHLRTTGLLYRRGLVAPSARPVTIWSEGPFAARAYQDLMRGKDNIQPGWHGVHAIRRAYGPVPAGQSGSPWMTTPVVSPVISDTGEIMKDVDRRQFTVAAPQAEGFSGYPDGQAPAGLKHLAIGEAAFATVIAVAEDGKPLASTARVIISRTALDAENKETAGPVVMLRGLAAGDDWRFTITRPRSESGRVVTPSLSEEGVLTLPAGVWHEGELTRP